MLSLIVLGRLRLGRIAVHAWATAFVLASGEVRAAGSDAQIAQSLFDEARSLMDAGRYAEACPKLAESQRLDPGGGTLLNLALCHEQEGKTATAWLEFREALGQAERDRREDRIDFARTHVRDLEPRLVRLVLVVSEELASKGVVVQLDTTRVPREAWGSALPVDPGEHRVVATVGDAEWTKTVAATAGGGAPITVRVEEPTRALTPPPTTSRRRSTAFWLTLSGAGALAVTSAVTGILALDESQYVADHCSTERDFCWAKDADDAKTRARTLAWISTGALGGAIAAAAIAFVLPLDSRANVSAGVLVDDQRALATLRWRTF